MYYKRCELLRMLRVNFKWLFLKITIENIVKKEEENETDHFLNFSTMGIINSSHFYD